MNRYDYEKAVYDPDNGLTAAQVAVALWYGMHKNWNKDGLAWGSAENIARDIRMSPRTVDRARPVLEEQGWLVDTGERAHNGKGRPCVKYDLGVPTFPETQSGNGEEETPTFSDIVTDFSDNQSDFSDIETDFSDTVSDEEVREQVSEQEREEVTTTSADAGVVDADSKVRAELEPVLTDETSTAHLSNVGNRDAAQPRKKRPDIFDTDWDALWQNKLKEKAT